MATPVDILDSHKKGIMKQKGFTLVELLVVIAIIGVLATLVLLQLGTARARARDTQRISHVSQLRTAVEQYYEDNNGIYPDDLSDVEPRYIQSVPVDPLTGDPYGYAKDDTTDSYHIWAALENKAAALSNDIDINSGGWGGEDHSQAASETCEDQDDCFYDTGIDNN